MKQSLDGSSLMFNFEGTREYQPFLSSSVKQSLDGSSLLFDFGDTREYQFMSLAIHPVHIYRE